MHDVVSLIFGSFVVVVVGGGGGGAAAAVAIPSGQLWGPPGIRICTESQTETDRQTDGETDRNSYRDSVPFNLIDPYPSSRNVLKQDPEAKICCITYQ